MCAINDHERVQGLLRQGTAIYRCACIRARVCMHMDLQGEYVESVGREINGMPVWLRAAGGGMLFAGERWNLTPHVDQHQHQHLRGMLQSEPHHGRPPYETRWTAEHYVVTSEAEYEAARWPRNLWVLAPTQPRLQVRDLEHA